jgi:NTP pyrophosphatase (non-canonical NTP hydrolase)
MNAELASLLRRIQRFARERDWEQFHTPKNLAMALSVEASEVVELFQWLTVAESRKLPESKVRDLADELADTYIYLLKLADQFGIDLNQAATAKLKKNAVKYPVSKARGSAKKYTEL